MGHPGEPCRDTVAWFAERGILVAPGEFYGARGAEHVRIALTATDERIAAAVAGWPDLVWSPRIPSWHSGAMDAITDVPSPTNEPVCMNTRRSQERKRLKAASVADRGADRPAARHRRPPYVMGAGARVDVVQPRTTVRSSAH